MIANNIPTGRPIEEKRLRQVKSLLWYNYPRPIKTFVGYNNVNSSYCKQDIQALAGLVRTIKQTRKLITRLLIQKREIQQATHLEHTIIFNSQRF